MLGTFHLYFAHLYDWEINKPLSDLNRSGLVTLSTTSKMRVAIKHRCLLFLLCIHVGNVFKAKSLITKIKTEYMKGKTVVSSYRTLYGYSKSACVSKCLADATNGVCKTVGYDTSTRMCFLSSSDTFEEGGPNSGAFVLIKKGKIRRFALHFNERVLF